MKCHVPIVLPYERQADRAYLQHSLKRRRLNWKRCVGGALALLNTFHGSLIRRARAFHTKCAWAANYQIYSQWPRIWLEIGTQYHPWQKQRKWGNSLFRLMITFNSSAELKSDVPTKNFLIERIKRWNRAHISSFIYAFWSLVYTCIKTYLHFLSWIQ